MSAPADEAKSVLWDSEKDGEYTVGPFPVTREYEPGLFAGLAKVSSWGVLRHGIPESDGCG